MDKKNIILVCGLNGVGKSTFAKALAKELGYRFVDIEDVYFSNGIIQITRMKNPVLMRKLYLY